MELDTIVDELVEVYGVSVEGILQELNNRKVLIDNSSYGGDTIQQGNTCWNVLKQYLSELKLTKRKMLKIQNKEFKKRIVYDRKHVNIYNY